MIDRHRFAGLAAMKERPILFKGELVRAILADRKTQTRRLMKPQPVGRAGVVWPAEDRWGWSSAAGRTMVDEREAPCCCPYGYKRERLWVRETWRYADWTEDGQPWIQYAADDARRLCERVTPDWTERVANAWAELSAAENVAIDGRASDRQWRPSIFLPRWASRLTLEVTGVRVQRLQDLTEADAQAEGVKPFAEAFKGISLDQPIVCGDRPNFLAGDSPYRAAFACLWDEINGDRATWASNPWAWAITFQRVEGKP